MISLPIKMFKLFLALLALLCLTINAQNNNFNGILNRDVLTQWTHETPNSFFIDNQNVRLIEQFTFSNFPSLILGKTLICIQAQIKYPKLVLADSDKDT